MVEQSGRLLEHGKHMTKTIHVHVGPHKTGSTAIQNTIRKHDNLFRRDYGLYAVDDPSLREMAKALNDIEAINLARATERVVSLCQRLPGDCLISCEDLSGDLPGRTSKRRPYPRLWENINFIRNAFSGYQCKFYFFVRNPKNWVWSAYVQNLKHRKRFCSFEEYTSFLHQQRLWDQTLEKTRGKLGVDFVELPYLEGIGYSSSLTLFSSILDKKEGLEFIRGEARLNATPSKNLVTILESINKSGSSTHAIQNAKHYLFENDTLKKPTLNLLIPKRWPPDNLKPKWLSRDLFSLWERVAKRIHQQSQPNLLPERNCDLSQYRLRPVVASGDFPDSGRQCMESQSRILKYRFRDLPETCYLLGLTISYLRRNTTSTGDAVFLFQRLWEEEHEVLLASLPTRWLISTFQTFMDHGVNDAQKMIGSSSYFFSNTMKAYEAERALEGLSAGGTYPNSAPVTNTGFVGMDRFNLGGTDLLLNMNALLLELASMDDRAGRVTHEFMLRMKKSQTILSRMDQSRLKHGIDIKQFSNCWSFFDRPETEESNKN